MGSRTLPRPSSPASPTTWSAGSRHSDSTTTGRSWPRPSDGSSSTCPAVSHADRGEHSFTCRRSGHGLPNGLHVSTASGHCLFEEELRKRAQRAVAAFAALTHIVGDSVKTAERAVFEISNLAGKLSSSFLLPDPRT
jgi:hypothetical protein